MMHLVRCLFFFAAKYNFVLVAKQIPIISNTLADALSRNKLELFFSLARSATPIPLSLLVGLVLKKPDWTSLDWTGLTGSPLLSVLPSPVDSTGLRICVERSDI